MFDLTNEHAFDTLCVQSEHTFVSHPVRTVWNVSSTPDEPGGTSTMTISASTLTRVVVLLISISLVLVLLLTGAVTASAADEPVVSPVVPEVEHTVAIGDTLWDIAAVYTDPGDDVRETVHDIKAANELADSVIRVGQVLVIPLEF